jgi:hypothetical protein
MGVDVPVWGARDPLAATRPWGTCTPFASTHAFTSNSHVRPVSTWHIATVSRNHEEVMPVPSCSTWCIAVIAQRLGGAPNFVGCRDRVSMVRETTCLCSRRTC